jgi:hypothetical protein
MELQDFAPHLLFVQLVFKEQSPAVIDQRAKWITTLRDDFGAAECTAEAAAVEAFSGDKREQYRVGTAQIVASVENFDDVHEASEKLGQFARTALDRLERPQVAHLRVRTIDLAATDSFEGLRDALAEGFSVPRGEVADLVGSPMSDAGWVFEFTDGNPQVTFRFGPMRASQIKTMLRDQRDDQYPAEFLFLETDYVQNEVDLDLDEAVDRLAANIDNERTIVHRVAHWLTEKVANDSISTT